MIDCNGIANQFLMETKCLKVIYKMRNCGAELIEILLDGMEGQNTEGGETKN